MTEAEAKRFYRSWTWQRKRDEVLRHDKHECQHCKQRGRYRRAQMIHQGQALKKRPDLALDTWVDGVRQLVSLCNKCHEEVHGAAHAPRIPLTPERW